MKTPERGVAGAGVQRAAKSAPLAAAFGRHLVGARPRGPSPLAVSPLLSRPNRWAQCPGLESERSAAGMQRVTDVQRAGATMVSPWLSHATSPKPGTAHSSIPSGAESGPHCFIMDRIKECCGLLFQSVSPRSNFKYASRL